MKTRPSLAVLAAALLWTSAGWVGNASRTGLTPIALAEARLLLGGSALLLWAGPRCAWASLRALPGRELLAGMSALALFQWGFFVAVGRIGAGLVILLTTATGPLAAQALSAARSGSRLGRRWLAAALLLALAAVAVGADGGGWGGLLGALVATGSGVAYAAYAAATARLDRDVASSRGRLVTTGVALTGAGVLLAPVAIGTRWPAPSLDAMVALLYLGLVTTALAYALFASGLRVLAPERALGLLTVQPVVAIAGDLLMHRAGDISISPWPVWLAGSALIARSVPWPLTLVPRRDAGTASRDGSCTQCP